MCFNHTKMFWILGFGGCWSRIRNQYLNMGVLDNLCFVNWAYQGASVSFPNPWFSLMMWSNHWILSTVRIPNSRDAFQVGLDAPIKLLWILLWSQLNLCSNWMCDLRKLSLKKLGSQLQGPRWHLLLRCKVIFIVQELHFFNCLHYHHGTSATFVAALD